MNEIRSLTSLRGLAALYVALLHYSTAIQKHTEVNIPALAPRGHLAVDFFFILSGFIMAYTYADDFARRGAGAMPSFLVKRAARLLPLHWATTIVLVIYTLAVAPSFSGGPPPAFSSATPWTDILLNLALLQGLGFAPNMNAPSWSISVEMFAYVCFPLFLLAGFHRSSLVRTGFIALLVATLAAVASRSQNLSLDTIELPVGWTILRGFSEFALGICTYRLFSVAPTRNIWTGETTFAAASLVAVAMMVLRLWDLLAVLAFPIIIAGAANQKNRLATLLDNRLLHFLGVISFSLYLIHYPIAYLQLQILQAMHPAQLGRWPALALAFVGALSTIPLAWITYVVIEHPGRTLIRNIVRPSLTN